MVRNKLFIGNYKGEGFKKGEETRKVSFLLNLFVMKFSCMLIYISIDVCYAFAYVCIHGFIQGLYVFFTGFDFIIVIFSRLTDGQVKRK